MPVNQKIKVWQPLIEFWISEGSLVRDNTTMFFGDNYDKHQGKNQESNIRQCKEP